VFLILRLHDELGGRKQKQTHLEKEKEAVRGNAPKGRVFDKPAKPQKLKGNAKLSSQEGKNQVPKIFGGAQRMGRGEKPLTKLKEIQKKSRKSVAEQALRFRGATCFDAAGGSVS